MNPHTVKALTEQMARVDKANDAEKLALSKLGQPGTSWAIQRQEHENAKNGSMFAMASLVGTVRGILESVSKNWWEDRANICDLLEWLEDRDEIATDCIGHVVEILEKPWNWTKEYNAMRGEQRDTDPAPPMFANDPFPAKRAR